MRVKRRTFTIGLLLVALFLLPSATFAGQGPKVTTVPAGDWSALKTVLSGSKLVVKLKNGKTVTGKLSGDFSDTALSLSVKNKLLDLIREDVLSVYQITGKSARKATLIGLGVGAGGGAAIGVAVGAGENDFPLITKPQAAAGFAILGAGVGALTGYLIGRGGHKRVLIYEAKQP
jgi:hypothetical protein